jgi:hypothetical protein
MVNQSFFETYKSRCGCGTRLDAEAIAAGLRFCPACAEAWDRKEAEYQPRDPVSADVAPR